MATKPAVKPEQKVLNIKMVNVQRIEFRIYGTSPLIVHQWSQKALKQLEKTKEEKKIDKQRAGLARTPQEDYEASMYRLSDGGHGFPAIGLKKAVVSAANDSGMQQTMARRLLHVEEEERGLVRIHGEPSMRCDTVRVGTGMNRPADLRYRAEYSQWWAKVVVRYNAEIITESQLLALFEAAGFSVGIGEWRPEKNGSYGTFTTMAPNKGGNNGVNV